MQFQEALFFRPTIVTWLSVLISGLICSPASLWAAIPNQPAAIAPVPLVKAPKNESVQTPEEILRKRMVEKAQRASLSQVSLIFDIPVTFNSRVGYWLNYFQSRGKGWFREWLEKATKYMPFITKELKNAGLPMDLGYIVMIESGFEPNAQSIAKAMGPWQFIQPTGERYGLRVSWWLDERRDLLKATRAATRYLRDLHLDFGSWYLVAASYNMGENGMRRQIKKHGTRDFWALSKLKAIPQETIDYVPKILAAMLIAKAPGLYGFRDVAKMNPLEYDTLEAAGGTDLNNLADHLGVTRKALKDMNAELILGYIPVQVEKHLIRVPKGAQNLASAYLKKKFPSASTAKQPILDKSAQQELKDKDKDSVKL